MGGCCVHKSNKLSERNRAVPEMHLIYGRAGCVNVWLGCPSRPCSSKPILDALNEDKPNEDDRFSLRCQILAKPHRNARAIQGLAKL